jgi:hypothetical protein
VHARPARKRKKKKKTIKTLKTSVPRNVGMNEKTREAKKILKKRTQAPYKEMRAKENTHVSMLTRKHHNLIKLAEVPKEVIHAWTSSRSPAMLALQSFGTKRVLVSMSVNGYKEQERKVSEGGRE